MKRHSPFRGLGVALATPFKTDGSVDFEKLRLLAESQIGGGADFLCVLGTTAETPCLSAEEQAAVVRTVKEVNRSRVPLLLGAGGNCTHLVVENLKRTDLQGIAGVLIVAPYYNKPSQEGLYRHFKAVAEASPLPVVLYNVPSRTGVNLEADTTLRIAADCPNVVAVKEASGRVEQIERIIRRAPQGFEVLSGDDALTLKLIGMGATGVISVIGNAFPGRFGEMVHKALAGETAQAQAIDGQLQPIYRLLSADGNPAGIKALLALQGKAENVLRLPLVPATEETVQAIKAELDTQGTGNRV